MVLTPLKQPSLTVSNEINADQLSWTWAGETCGLLVYLVDRQTNQTVFTREMILNSGTSSMSGFSEVLTPGRMYRLVTATQNRNRVISHVSDFLYAPTTSPY